MLESLLFVVMGTIMIVCAGGVVFQKNPIYSAIFLIQTMVSLAVLYVLLHAQFIAVVQVMVYAGAVMVLFVFVIMLLNIDKIEEEMGKDRLVYQKVTAIFFGLLLFAVIGIVTLKSVLQGTKGEYTPEKISEIGNTQLVGKLLFTDYIFPFEIASILLFAATIGALILAKKGLKE
ncbi:MAG: NADH-quinone oxidoreductase subunit J [Candidatus Scalindua sp. AMX11]|nr:MAG: NADH-quinone oxidoreductase subunit J [Candidatus Scalindua sp.]NOG82756.1 NADH-quinone oxidoreductase subunit J [Planctomycetota bacterium]RZV95324.1 MAG: NADH-quinone oxidoreductase subunit J [Candidatus Scalindua sp. SCAELEC01]TDE66194.1 MAG: NADH-quinone oxidoreductase subunit J [Candidatus Scalindua sp. AMX11]GJQ57812.1 MAG: NADH dehydrogenase subunit J [Candidatus Scalindua sp.]